MDVYKRVHLGRSLSWCVDVCKRVHLGRSLSRAANKQEEND